MRNLMWAIITKSTTKCQKHLPLVPAQNPPINPPIRALVKGLSFPRTLSSIQVVAPNTEKPNAAHTDCYLSVYSTVQLPRMSMYSYNKHTAPTDDKVAKMWSNTSDVPLSIYNSETVCGLAHLSIISHRWELIVPCDNPTVFSCRPNPDIRAKADHRSSHIIHHWIV